MLSSTGTGDDRNGSITANEFTDFTAFDALRATLDLNGVAGMPLTTDLVYIKLDENNAGTPDDVNLMGFNLGTKFDAADSELEAYFLNKRDRQGTVANVDKNGSISTMGMRGSAKPVEGSNVYGELAYQFGREGNRLDGDTGVGGIQSATTHHAWAFDLGADYTLANVATTPMLGAEWIFYSGMDKNGAFAGWDPIASSYFPTMIRAFQTRAGVTGLYPVDAGGVPGGFTNSHQLALYGSLKPIEDLTIAPRLTWFVADKGILAPGGAVGGVDGKRKSFIGTEWDTKVTYNYTDDVQFGLAYALFAPGNVFRKTSGVHAGVGGQDPAQELISTVSVKF